MKIVDMSKFIRSILVLLGVIILISLFINNVTLSHGEVEYKTIYVSNGDTLWNIAEQERNSNIYYEGKDIRDIIYDIKSVNNLATSEIYIGQNLIIPVI